MAKGQASLIPAERIEHSILLLRGQKVLLDADLAGVGNAGPESMGKTLGSPGPRYILWKTLSKT